MTVRAVVLDLLRAIPELAGRQTADRARYGAFIKEAGIKVD